MTRKYIAFDFPYLTASLSALGFVFPSLFVCDNSVSDTIIVTKNEKSHLLMAISDLRTKN
jgi:hypothetical protein